ncbi:hypothetical protein [Mucilaginibacter sp. HD30]
MENIHNEDFAIGKIIKKSALIVPDNGFEQQVIAKLQIAQQRSERLRHVKYSCVCILIFTTFGLIICHQLASLKTIGETGLFTFQMGFVFLLLIYADHVIRFLKEKIWNTSTPSIGTY